MAFVLDNPRTLRLLLVGAGLVLALLALLGVAPDALAQEEHGAEGGEEEEGGSFLVSPGLGLMLWTLLLFGVTMFFLSKTAFPKIGEALERRANAIRQNIEESEKTRQEAEELLAEYRARLKEAREQADDIQARARKAAEAAIAEATTEGKAKREELVAAARKDIETETLTRKSLSGQDHQKLVEEALAEVDFGALAGDANGGSQA